MNDITMVELFQGEPDTSSPQALAEWLSARCDSSLLQVVLDNFINLTCHTQDEIDADVRDDRQSCCVLEMVRSNSGEVGVLFAQYPADENPDLMDRKLADKYSRFLRVRNQKIVAIIKPTELK